MDYFSKLSHDVGSHTYQVCAKTGKCLAPASASSAALAKLVQSTKSSATSQKWKITSYGLGFYFLCGSQSGMCSAVNGNSSTSVGDAVQDNYHTTNNQEWTIVPAT